MKKVLLVAILFFAYTFTNSSYAQVAFEDSTTNPVFSYSGVPGSFDQMRVFSQDIIKVGGEYWMYYSGVPNGNSVQIGLAKSQNGLNWTRYSSQPIFRCGENTLTSCSTTAGWSNFRVEVISVEYDGNGFKMWYRGNNDNANTYGEVGYATSNDGIIWDAYDQNPVFNAQGKPSIIYTSVIKIEDGYRLYYTDGLNSVFYYTESANGISWTSPVSLGSARVNTVQKINDSYVAVDNRNVLTSQDGVSFDFQSPVATISNNLGLGQGRVSMIVENGVVRTWRPHLLGNIIWSFGNMGIYYSTLSESLLFPDVVNEYPLYTQIESSYPSIVETSDWADDTFAYGSQEWCGDTIGGCGCAITSGVMAGRNADITTDIVGNDVNPKNINGYLRSVGGYTSDGSVSWLAMQAYLGELTDDGRLASRFQYVGKYEGVAAMSAVDQYLENEGEYAVLAFKNSLGHFVWLPAKTGDSYVVRDPLWYLTQTTNDTTGTKIKDYNDSFDSVRVFEISEEPVVASGSGVEAYVKGTAELIYKDANGSAVGYTSGGTVVNLPNSSYGNAEVIGLNGTPSPIAGGKHLLVSDASNEFTIEVIGTGTGGFEMEFFTISETGEVTTYTFSGQTIPGVTSTFTFNLETGEVKEERISYEQFLSVLSLQLDGYTDQQKAFFMKWAEKMYSDMEEKTVSQALQSISVYGKLLIAKKVESPVLTSVLDLLTEGVKRR